MEVNGYGYEDYAISQGTIKMPNYQVSVSEGEFILNQFNGKKQLFKPIQMHLHAPSEHTIDGRYHDVELHILH